MTKWEFFLQHRVAELPRLLGVLEATPEDRLDYRPHPKSRSAYELIAHVIGHGQDPQRIEHAGSRQSPRRVTRAPRRPCRFGLSVASAQ